MNAVSRLFWAVSSFDDAWRAHAATMRSATVLSFSKDLAPNLGAALQFAKGFDHALALEDLFEELEYLKRDDYKALRINCLLGVCASFESFSKTFIAALSYEPQWRIKASSDDVLSQDTSLDFIERFSTADRKWRSKYLVLLGTEFDWVDSEYINAVGDVFWLRNQVAHNAGLASKDHTLDAFGDDFEKGQPVVIDQIRLSRCVNILWKCVKHIADGTPYMKAI